MLADKGQTTKVEGGSLKMIRYQHAIKNRVDGKSNGSKTQDNCARPHQIKEKEPT